MKIGRPMIPQSKVRWNMLASVIVVVSVLALMGRAFYVIWDLGRPPVSARLLRQLNSSFDTNTVVRLLGAPDDVDTWSTEKQTYIEWTYSRPGRWKIVTLEFGSDGHFKDYLTD